MIQRGIYLLCGAALLLTALPAAAQINIFNNSQIRGYDEFRGPYAQFGVSIGQIELDKVGTQRFESDVGGGFTMGGGFRWNSWLALEANLSYIGGGDTDAKVGRNGVNVGTSEAFAITFGPKLYFLGALPELPIPELFQPYFLVGIGGGEYENNGKNRGQDEERSSFVARFKGGFDVWVTDNIGIFAEGGYQVWDDESVDGIGLGTFGGQYRF